MARSAGRQKHLSVPSGADIGFPGFPVLAAAGLLSFPREKTLLV
jgi:hypothetical protein